MGNNKSYSGKKPNSNHHNNNNKKRGSLISNVNNHRMNKQDLKNKLNDGVLVYNGPLTVSELAEKLGISAVDVVRSLFLEKIMVNVNTTLNDDYIELVALKYGYEVQKEKVVELEKIEPTEEDITAEYKAIADAYKMEIEKVQEALEKDAENIKKYLKGYNICLDINGKMLKSEEFSQFILNTIEEHNWTRDILGDTVEFLTEEQENLYESLGGGYESEEIDEFIYNDKVNLEISRRLKEQGVTSYLYTNEEYLDEIRNGSIICEGINVEEIKNMITE